MSVLPYEAEAVNFVNGGGAPAAITVTKTVSDNDKVPLLVLPNDGTEAAKIVAIYSQSYNATTKVWSFTYIVNAGQTAACTIHWLKLHSTIKGGF